MQQTSGFGDDFLAGGGDMGALMRAHDWAATPLGPLNQWPQSLRTSVSTCLSCAFPILLWWGPDLVMLYNDEYISVLGATKHPAALGRAGAAVWPEIWDVIAPMLGAVLARGEATRARDLLLLLNRAGYPEECYFSFSYSPIRDESGGVGGVFTPVIETTGRVIGARLLRTLQDLTTPAAGLAGPDAACQAVAAVLAGNPLDVPFAILFLADETGFRRAAVTGLEAADPAAAPAAWPLEAAIVGGVPLLLDRGLPVLPGNAWPEPPRAVLVLPIAPPGQDRLAAVLVVGASPRRPLDAAYRGWFELVAGRIGMLLGEAMAYAAERQRAAALAEIDRAKTAFFSNVSHEFRTPLTLMLGPIEDLLAQPAQLLAAPARALLEVAHRNALRLLRLVNSLLDFARLEAGRLAASFAPTDLAALTVDLASVFRAAMERAGLDFTVECPPLPAPVCVDRDMWEKIVLNLLSNALKFTFAGGVAVQLRPTADGKGAELIVRDSGIGIPPADLPHVFERFHRVEGAQGRSIEGSGIGLALLHELVKLHGGKVGVESEIGVGSRFIVTIPFGSAHLPPDRIRPTAPAALSRPDAFVAEAMRWLGDTDGDLAPASAKVSVPVGRVLVVDDNADMRSYVRSLLAAYWEVDAVGDGLAALDAMRANAPDLVLSDVMMPNLDGFGLLRAIRADPALRDIPVILLSARAGEEAAIEGLDATADDYLVKPFSARELIARISANLTLARSRRETAETLRQANEGLERRVAARTAELVAANVALRQQMQERERAESTLRQMQRLEAIGQLTSGVAHDFNNLLTVVLGCVERLEHGIGDPAQTQRRIAMIRSAAERGAALTAQLLAFARRQRLDPKPLALNDVLQGMADLLRSTLGPMVELVLDLAPNARPALADRTQLELVVLNLAINARDAMPEGGHLTLRIANAAIASAEAEHDPEPGLYTALTIADTGGGMSPAVLARAFEPFFTTKETGRGSGLGLPQVLGFAKQSGGGVRIASAEGRGTAVTVFLLHAEGDAVAAQSAASSPAAPGGAGKRVLLVDDDAGVREVTAALLLELGYELVEAADGAAALAVLEMRPVDLVLADVAMPGMNGPELGRRVAARWPALPVVFVTGYADLGALTGIDEARVLSKPYTGDALAWRLHAALRGAQPGL